MPQFKGDGLGCLRLAGEPVFDLSGSETRNILPVLGLSLGQGSDVLLDQRTQCSLIEVADEVVDELSRIGITLLPYLENAVVVHAFQRVQRHRCEACLVPVDRAGDRVGEDTLRREVLILQRQLELRHHRLERSLVLGDIREVEIEQLHHRLHILRDTGAAEHLVVV